MKKIIALFIAVLYFTASSGVVLKLHYCMGKVSSVKVDNFSTQSCKCGSTDDTGSCCKTEFKVVKLANAHKATVASFDVQLPVANLPSPTSLIDAYSILPVATTPFVAHDPPFTTAKIYIKNNVFRV